MLAVIGIATLLIAILLPAITAARENARIVTCASNIRQLALGLMTYANGYRGVLPPNVSLPKPGLYWYDFDRVGQLLTPTQGSVIGKIAACPDDEGAVRSYAMNAWASSKLDSSVTSTGAGTLWKLSIKGSDRYILLAERWSYTSSSMGWTTYPTIGSYSDPPGRRFGGGIGLSPLINVGRFGIVNTELPYQRHRTPRSMARGTAAIGRVNIAYGDGHVALKSNSDLADPTTGLSTLDSLWSPKDFELNQP